MANYATLECMNRKKASARGGFTKWSKIPKEKRSEIMRKVALARWGKKLEK